MSNERQGVFYSDQPAGGGSGYHAEASAHPNDPEYEEFRRQSTKRWDLLGSIKELINEVLYNKTSSKT